MYRAVGFGEAARWRAAPGQPLQEQQTCTATEEGAPVTRQQADVRLCHSRSGL